MKKIILNILLISFICILIYSLIQIIEWFNESNKTSEQIKVIQEMANIVETEETNSTNVDFEKLKKTNEDVVGWIKVKGTNIDYPFVQASNNEFYLDHSFDKTYNKAGWVFLDYRNNINELNKNTILYAHNRKDGTMFETLKNVITKQWDEEQDNLIIKMFTEKENLEWQVFSVYTIENTDDYLKINFNSNEEFNNFANKLKKRSVFDFNTNILEDDNILTLSTCYINNQKRVVLHAKLLK